MSNTKSYWVITWKTTKPIVLTRPKNNEPITTNYIEMLINELRGIAQYKITEHSAQLGNGVVFIHIITRDAVIHIRMRIDFKDIKRDSIDEAEAQADLINYILYDKKGEKKRIIDEIERIEVISSTIVFSTSTDPDDRDDEYINMTEFLSILLELLEMEPATVNYQVTCQGVTKA